MQVVKRRKKHYIVSVILSVAVLGLYSVWQLLATKSYYSSVITEEAVVVQSQVIPERTETTFSTEGNNVIPSNRTYPEEGLVEFTTPTLVDWVDSVPLAAIAKPKDKITVTYQTVETSSRFNPSHKEKEEPRIIDITFKNTSYHFHDRVSASN